MVGELNLDHAVLCSSVSGDTQLPNSIMASSRPVQDALGTLAPPPTGEVPGGQHSGEDGSLQQTRGAQEEAQVRGGGEEKAMCSSETSQSPSPAPPLDHIPPSSPEPIHSPWRRLLWQAQLLRQTSLGPTARPKLMDSRPLWQRLLKAPEVSLLGWEGRQYLCC